MNVNCGKVVFFIFIIHIVYQCIISELCHDSQTISAVTQDARIALMSGCDVKITAVGIDGDHQSVFKPFTVELHELGLKGQNTLILSPFNSVVPLFNPTHNMVRLTKGWLVRTMVIFIINLLELSYKTISISAQRRLV